MTLGKWLKNLKNPVILRLEHNNFFFILTHISLLEDIPVGGDDAGSQLPIVRICSGSYLRIVGPLDVSLKMPHSVLEKII